MSVSYRDVLLDHLQKSGWEHVENLPIRYDTEVEVWRIRSFTTNWGFELFLSLNRTQPTFRNDEMKGDEVTDISLFSKYEEDAPNGTEELAWISRKKKRMEREIGAFVEVMNRLRDEG